MICSTCSTPGILSAHNTYPTDTSTQIQEGSLGKDSGAIPRTAKLQPVDRDMGIQKQSYRYCDSVSLSLNVSVMHGSNWTVVMRVYYVYIKKFKSQCLQCFDPVGWVAGRASGL